jgi:hypothetical protein
MKARAACGSRQPLLARKSTLMRNPRHLPLRVILVDLRSEPRWEAFLASHPDAVIYQHPVWIRALEKESGREPRS